MNIRYAQPPDLKNLSTNEPSISPEQLAKKIADQRVLIVEVEGVFTGWLRFGYFWDCLPFMNMLHILEEWRGMGLGAGLVSFWEDEMLRTGYNLVMTSTMSNENAQHFYRRLGYIDAGALLLPGEPLEIILIKRLVDLDNTTNNQ
jgi:ribosomal protein S18 acetylase RimI-like enzyme